jgi:hypothetical protein
MAFTLVGSINVGPTSHKVLVGSVDVPAQGIELRVIQTSSNLYSTLSYGLAYLQTSAGRDFGTIKVYGRTEGEDYRMGHGLSGITGTAQLFFEPRSYNLRWIKAETPPIWSLTFLAQPAILSDDIANGSASPFGVHWVGSFANTAQNSISTIVRNNLINLVLP